jgi:hemoglobin-like flavoprotein
MDKALIERLEGSFKPLAARGPELVDRFYSHLFAENPAVRPMFPADISGQKKKLLASIVLVIQNLRSPERLGEPLREMGARHVTYGTQPEHYPIVRDTLIGVMKDMSGAAWSDQLSVDWRAALDLVSSVMLEGHRASLASIEFMS